jgi:hypothetical protein
MRPGQAISSGEQGCNDLVTAITAGADELITTG